MLHWPSGLCQCPSRWILFIVAASTARLLRARTASARPPSHLCNLSVHLHLHLPTHASVQTPAGRNPISMYEAKSECRTATLLVWTRRSQRAARSLQPQQPAIHTSIRMSMLMSAHLSAHMSIHISAHIAATLGTVRHESTTMGAHPTQNKTLIKCARCTCSRAHMQRFGGGARHTPARASVIIAMCVGAARMYRRHRPPWHRPPWHRPPWQPCRIMSQTNPHAHMV